MLLLIAIKGNAVAASRGKSGGASRSPFMNIKRKFDASRENARPDASEFANGTSARGMGDAKANDKKLRAGVGGVGG